MDMRAIMALVEAPYDTDEDETTEEQSFEHLPPIAGLDALRPNMVAVAQKQYDTWEQDEDGYDEEVGHGGICHLIAEDIAGILYGAGYAAWTQCSTMEQHVTVVVQCRDGIVDVDVPYRLYEHGGGFTWTKIPGVTFEPNDVAIYTLDRDPAEIAQYVEGYEAD